MQRILFLNRIEMCDVWWKVDFTCQLAMTSSVVGPKRSSKALPKAHQKKKKKRSWTLFSGLLPIWSTTAFWILAKPLYLRGMLSKSMRCTPKTATPAASTDQQKGPNSFPWQHQTTHRIILQQSKMNWATKFCLICHIHLTSRQLTTTSSSILTTSCRENAPTTSRIQKMLSKSSSNPEAWIFTL